MDEVEEGEACYFKDNSRVDPDIDLSYIDEKVQNVLGHFQKDFEGLVSVESLGAKYGDYGSFLPTHRRSPSIWSQPKNHKEVHNVSSREAPKVLPMEGAPIEVAQSTRLGAASRSVPSLNTAMVPSTGTSTKMDSRLPLAQGKKSLGKEEPVMNKQANSSDQRTLKLRIKINSDNTGKNKAAIYSGFGLNTPSSSLGNSEDSSGMPSQCAGTRDESPSNILQFMTSFPVPGGSPLSPLIESLLCLEMKEKYSETSSPKAVKRFSKERKKRVVEKSENTLISNGEVGMNLHDRRSVGMKPEVEAKVGNIESGPIGPGSSFFSDKKPDPVSRKVSDSVSNEKGFEMAPRVCKEAERNVSRKNMEVGKIRMEEMLSLGLVREESMESISDHNGGNFEKREILSSSVEISESRSKNYCKDESVNAIKNVHCGRDGNFTKADSDVSNCSRDLFGQMVVGQEKDEVKLPHGGVVKSSSKGKKKSTSTQNSVDLASEAEGSLISGSFEVTKGKNNSGKMRNLKLHHDMKMDYDSCKALQPDSTGQQVTNHMHNSLERPCGNIESKFNRGALEKKQWSSLNKSREKSTQEDGNAQLLPDPSLKESANDGDLSTQVGLVSMVEPTPAEPIVIEEDWVQCDSCERWRLLPYGTDSKHLPDKWVCTMLNWLHGMNRCEISEDDTTQALRRLYQPESQSNLTNHVDIIVPGVTSPEGLPLERDHLNPSSNCKPDPRKMKTKLKETHFAASNSGSALISGSVKSSKEDVVKSRSLTDMNQKFCVERNSHKREENNKKCGDTEEKKLKSKRVADEYKYETPKRTRVDAPSGVVKTSKKVSSSAISEGKLLQPGSLEMKPYGEREISLKKRKLKDWQETQNHVGAMKDDVNHLNERKEFIKEETSDNEFRKVKKCAISDVEGKEFVLRKADAKFKTIGKVTKLQDQVHRKKESFNREKGQQARKHTKIGFASDDVDILNRDLGSEQFSRAATSSSSKVSDSLKSRSHFLEAKGSPVESVSSSPIRTLKFEQLSPARGDNLRSNASKNGHISMVDSAKKSLNEGKTEIKQSGTAKRAKISGISHSESPGFPALDVRDNSNGQKFGGKSRVRGGSPDKDRIIHLVKNEPENLENPYPGDLQLLDRHHSDDKSNKNLSSANALFREKSKKGSSLLSKGKDGSSGSNPEGIKKVSARPSEMLVKSKGSLSDGTRTGLNHGTHVALLHGDSRDLKCRIKLVKDDRNDQPTMGTPLQDPIQRFNDGVATGSDLTRIESAGGSSSQVVSDHVAKNDPPAQISSSIPRSHKGNAFDVVPTDSSGSGDSLKGPKQYKDVPSPLRNDASCQSSAAFRKAEYLKGCGDRFKDSGFPVEGNEAYFQAVLHFLIAASLRESCNYDSNKHGEMSPMQIYSSTAKLCKLCADEYEKRNELATAALAYKCMEVAYMRVVYCKNSTLSRDRLDLLASLRILPQGESPSSSASDVDSINNQVMVDKAALSKSIGSHAGNHIIAAHNHPNFVRLLDFTKDVNSAMEASYKSQNTFAAAIHKGAQYNEGIVSVKRVIDLSFQDVEELVRLVRAATDAISRQGFDGNKD